MLEIDLINYLKSYEPLMQLVGGRIYPGVLPENAAKPAVVYFEHEGAGHHNINVSFPQFQFSCFSPRYMEAKQVRQTIEDALKRYKGMMGNTRVLQGSVTFRRMLYENNTKLHNGLITIKILHREVM